MSGATVITCDKCGGSKRVLSEEDIARKLLHKVTNILTDFNLFEYDGKHFSRGEYALAYKHLMLMGKVAYAQEFTCEEQGYHWWNPVWVAYEALKPKPATLPEGYTGIPDAGAYKGNKHPIPRASNVRDMWRYTMIRSRAMYYSKLNEEMEVHMQDVYQCIYRDCPEAREAVLSTKGDIMLGPYNIVFTTPEPCKVLMELRDKDLADPNGPRVVMATETLTVEEAKARRKANLANESKFRKE